MNWWTWRPALEFLLRESLVDDEQAEMLQINGVGAALDSDTTTEAARVVEQFRSSMPADSRLMRDGTISTEPHESKPISDFNEDWYGAGRKALRAFRDFCASSGGFTVY